MRRGKAAGPVALGLVFACLSLCAPAALAAPPANDDFADAQVLPATLPAETTASNVEATKEEFESVGAFAAGHSVWFEWEAPSTGFVSVGSCQSPFQTVLGVFTGTALGSLTKVADGNASEGPHCQYSQGEYTFKATGGTTYEIAVDGNGFYFPEAPKPVSEGEFTLRIETTPLPPNDDFADAKAIEGSISEEPGGDRFYYGSAPGFTWNATKETGEPDIGGDQGGASVWYSWTAPETGNARVGVCCGFAPDLLGIYTGTSLEALTPIKKDDFTGFPVSGGVTYRFAVDGKFDAGAGAPRTGSFSIAISMILTPNRGLPASADPLGSTVPKDTEPPKTTIVKRAVRSSKRRATFAFDSSEPDSTFRCGLDGHRLEPCSASKTYKHLKPGRHSLAVVAVDTAGNEDPTPAIARFAIPKQLAK